jgi:transcriptional regulator with XRE-family HTH domain
MRKEECPETRDDVLDLIQAIEYERKKRRISVTRMLARAGISQPTWYHWLNGRYLPHMDMFLRLMLSMGMGLVMKGPTGQITVIRPRKMDVSETRGGGSAHAQAADAHGAAGDL